MLAGDAEAKRRPFSGPVSRTARTGGRSLTAMGSLPCTCPPRWVPPRGLSTCADGGYSNCPIEFSRSRQNITPVSPSGKVAEGRGRESELCSPSPTKRARRGWGPSLQIACLLQTFSHRSGSWSFRSFARRGHSHSLGVRKECLFRSNGLCLTTSRNSRTPVCSAKYAPNYPI